MFLYDVIIIIFSLLFVKATSKENTVEVVPIIGGENINIEEYNFVASISYRKLHICAATILLQDWLLTPAHCVNNYKPEQLEIIAGITNLLKPSKKILQKTQVIKILIHEKYHEASVLNNIALIKTATPLQYSFNVGRAKFSNIYNSKIGKYFVTCTVLGWASSRDKKKITNVRSLQPKKTQTNKLTYIEFYLLPDELCLKDFPVKFSKSLLCVGALDNFDLHCPSDLGGPLICMNMIAGIPIWNKHCNIILFTRIDYYSDWIKNKISTDNDTETQTLFRFKSIQGGSSRVKNNQLSFVFKTFLLYLSIL